MTRDSILTHKFVEYIPKDLTDGVIYVSIAFGTVVHKCCCGCGKEVVTPLSPTDWELTFDGQSISLNPSIGNWSFECQSHYWINRNKVRWAQRWSREEIEAGRSHDRLVKERYFHGTETPPIEDEPSPRGPLKENPAGSLWQKVKNSWF